MLLIDTFEPAALEDLLKQVTDVTRTSLNAASMSDYYWQAVDGHTVQLERKQAGELLADINHCELQLQKYLPNADEMGLIVEGIIMPEPEGTVVYKLSGDRRFFYRDGEYRVRFSLLMAWFWALDKCGITVYQVPTLEATAIAIGAMYSNSQKEEHTTLRRYIKEKIVAQSPDPYVLTLMGLRGAGLGETKAIALIEHFSTPFDVFVASEQELAEVKGIGKGIARKIHRSIGRGVK